MIIKNNYNEKNANPLDDYAGIGKGSHSLDKEFELEKEGFIKENMDNPVLQNLRGENDEDNSIDSNEDNWKFFR